MIDQEHPDDSDSVLGMEGFNLPIKITHRVLEESSDIFKGSPLLGHISGLSCGQDKLGKISFSLLGQSSPNHVSSFIDVRDSIEETLDSTNPLSEITSWIISII